MKEYPASVLVGIALSGPKKDRVISSRPNTADFSAISNLLEVAYLRARVEE